jgi:hypothetical protein
MPSVLNLGLHDDQAPRLALRSPEPAAAPYGLPGRSQTASVPGPFRAPGAKAELDLDAVWAMAAKAQ